MEYLSLRASRDSGGTRRWRAARSARAGAGSTVRRRADRGDGERAAGQPIVKKLGGLAGPPGDSRCRSSAPRREHRRQCRQDHAARGRKRRPCKASALGRDREQRQADAAQPRRPFTPRVRTSMTTAMNAALDAAVTTAIGRAEPSDSRLSIPPHPAVIAI
ncbi:hypothetical protein DM46_1341 [Burkholderia mallei]|nr:hypothetical protein DM46_1341 [Burkholderia mallei]